MDLLTHDTQMFLTGTRKEEFPKIIDHAKVFTVTEGKITNYDQ